MKLIEWFKKQPTRGKVVVLAVPAVVLVIAIGAALEGGEEEPEVIQVETVEAETPREATQATEEELTAELLVDVMEDVEPANIRRLCRFEDSVGEGVAIAQFELGYDRAKPNAEEVFEEVMERC